MKLIYLCLLSVVAVNCTRKVEKAPLDLDAYNSEIESWHQDRVKNLKGSTGWLNLAGLFWLSEGINTFGSGENNNMVFPAGKIPGRAGYYLLKGNSVTLETAPDVAIMSKGKVVKSMVAFNPDSARQPLQEYGSLQWFIIKRDDKFGVRLRDFKNPELENFKGIERFPVDPTWRLEATFEKADSSRTIEITNILGQTTPQSSPGTLVFTIGEKQCRLDVLDEGGDDYFLIFGDPTNAIETYGAGRYMYVKRPGQDGKTIVDFNKAYNPPCAFTAFATCPLPPKQNVLGVEVKAGEKNYGSYHQ